MSLILNIDTATEVASVSITENGSSLAFRKNERQREHASFVHAAIEDILKIAGLKLVDIDAFAVTSGPGSYTGLRVGMATAKGFCYAFSKPLITVNTLQLMAQAAVESLENIELDTLLCPMIDARRMEVFAALFDHELNEIWKPQPLLIEEKSFDDFFTNKKIVFFGSGSVKFKGIKTHSNAQFADIMQNAKHLGSLVDKKYKSKNFTDVSYSEPDYLKDFYSVPKV